MKKALAPIEEQIEAAAADVKSFEAVEANATRYLGKGWAAAADSNYDADAHGGRKSRLVPNLIPSTEQMHQLAAAIKAGTTLRVDLGMKVPASADAMQANEGLMPPTLLPGVVSLRIDPNRVLERIPSAPFEGPSLEFIQHTSTTGSATTVAAGALKPEASLNFNKQILTPAKIAVFSTVNDEVLGDFKGIQQYITEHLQNLVIDQENNQLINGDGTGTNMLGLLNQSGILTRSVGTDTGLDAIEQAIDDLLVGPAFAEADTIIMNPATRSKLRRTKDSQGRYILNPDPSAEEAKSLWGVPLAVTTKMPAGTAIVANLEESATAFLREGLSIQTGKPGDTFQRNQTSFVCEERLNIGVQRPAGIVKVTGL